MRARSNPVGLVAVELFCPVLVHFNIAFLVKASMNDTKASCEHLFITTTATVGAPSPLSLSVSSSLAINETALFIQPPLTE